jgi:Protein of unknown function (DUF1566)
MQIKYLLIILLLLSGNSLVAKQASSIFTIKETKKLQEGEAEFWKEVKSENSIEYYIIYLQEYKNGFYSVKARKMIKKLEGKSRQKELAQESKLWKKIQNSKYEDGFVNFLELYPDSKHAKLARLKAKKYPVRPQPVFTDKKTALRWQNPTDLEKTDWKGSKEYCQNLDFEGKEDWYLPNIDELRTLADKTRTPKIIKAFSNIDSLDHNYFWSSEYESSKRTHAWSINFKDDKNYNTNRSVKLYVRCVRKHIGE